MSEVPLYVPYSLDSGDEARARGQDGFITCSSHMGS